ncbi:hypothetical protein GQ457_15G002670 [Hibiscus cannabinus]
MDFGSVYTMRKAYSAEDIKVSLSYLCIAFRYFTSAATDVEAVSFFLGICVTLGNGNVSVIHSPLARPLTVSSRSIEDRREKLSRYRNKRTKRNFGRKIKLNDLVSSPSMLAGRLLPTVNRGSTEGSQRSKINPTTLRGNLLLTNLTIIK